MISMEKLTELLENAEWELFNARNEATENETLRAEIEAIRQQVEDLVEKLEEMEQPERDFVKNVLYVDVDGLRHVNTYTVKAMYNEIGADGVAEIKFELVDRITMTWSEIEAKGGVGEVNKTIKEKYNAERF